MLIQCLIGIQDLNAESGPRSGRPLRSYLLSKKINDDYYVCVRNSMYPNTISYKLACLDQMHTKFAQEGKISLSFKQPKHLILVQADDKSMLLLFLHQIQEILNGKKIIIGTRNMPKSMPSKKNLNPYDPSLSECVALHNFDNRILNMRNLNKLVLENCTLSLMPAQLGHLPISYLSLVGSKLATTRFGRDTYWDWMSGDAITDTLTTLKLDSTELMSLPFEIMFLKNLHTLSLNKNKLRYLPPCITELKKIQNLFVADNLLWYFPGGFFHRVFKVLDISNNMFTSDNTYRDDHIFIYARRLKRCDITVKKLYHLSISRLFQYGVKFKRQDIPRDLWPLLYVVSRCVHCVKFVMPDYTVVQHTIAVPGTHNLIKNHTTSSISWQTVVCQYNCDEYPMM